MKSIRSYAMALAASAWLAVLPAHAQGEAYPVKPV